MYVIIDNNNNYNYKQYTIKEVFSFRDTSTCTCSFVYYTLIVGSTCTRQYMQILKRFLYFSIREVVTNTTQLYMYD